VHQVGLHLLYRIEHDILLAWSGKGNGFDQDGSSACSDPPEGFLRDTVQRHCITGVNRNAGYAATCRKATDLCLTLDSSTPKRRKYDDDDGKLPCSGECQSPFPGTFRDVVLLHEEHCDVISIQMFRHEGDPYSGKESLLGLLYERKEPGSANRCGGRLAPFSDSGLICGPTRRGGSEDFGETGSEKMLHDLSALRIEHNIALSKTLHKAYPAGFLANSLPGSLSLAFAFRAKQVALK
jgi:hypothetical protein